MKERHIIAGLSDYPAEWEVQTLHRRINEVVHVPPSKSITNRALVLAALASMQGECHLENVLRSEDTEVMVAALQQLGFRLDVDWARRQIIVRQNREIRRIPASYADLHVANSGTTMRFLCAVLSLGQGRYRLDGIPRMRERPIQDLLDALNQLAGIHAWSEVGTGCPPVVIETVGAQARHVVTVRAEISSQFLSGLLMAAPYWVHDGDEVEIHVMGKRVSEPYIAMTLAMLRHWHHAVTEIPEGYRIRGASASAYRSYYTIEPDASAASYFWAVAAITGGQITVAGLDWSSLQGDVHFVKLLERMGCRVTTTFDGITVEGGPLHGIEADMNSISDTVMTLAAVACFASSPSRIYNVAHIRHKETDRIAAVAAELRKLGVRVEEADDGLTIHPQPLHGAVLDTYNDHRMAMSLALLGLRVPGVVIRHPACVVKTYPHFWQDLTRLGH